MRSLLKPEPILEPENERPGHDYVSNSFPDINKIDPQQAACVLLLEGLARDYILETWRSRYYGNEGLGGALAASYANGRCVNSKGTFVAAIGAPGFGKSEGMLSMINLIHPTYVQQGSDTEQAMHYADYLPGTIKFTDEIKFTDKIKDAWTYYQQGVPRNVTIKQNDGTFKTVKCASAPRLNYWFTCVDLQADEQIRNRIFQYEVKSDQDILDKIHAHRSKVASGKYITPEEEKIETTICRAITEILGPKTFEVIIPFAEQIKYHSTDPRTAKMFRDSIRASAIWNYEIRKVDEHDRLEADIADFKTALDMFNNIGGQSTNKFTEAEKAILNAIKSSGVVDGEYSATGPEIQKRSGLSKQRIYQVMYGRNMKSQQESNGLIAKCPQLSIDDSKKPYRNNLPSDFIIESSVNITLS